MHFWLAIRKPLEKLLLAGLSGMMLAVPALDLPTEFLWAGGVITAGLVVLKIWAGRISPE